MIRIELLGTRSSESVDRLRRIGSSRLGVHAQVNGLGREDVKISDANR